jgi:hypothetical protein
VLVVPFVFFAPFAIFASFAVKQKVVVISHLKCILIASFVVEAA